jgi:lambda family phage portal protein
MEQYVASFGYVGGRSDRKAMQEWEPAAGSANADLLDQHTTLRARSRDLCRNAPIAAGAASTSTTHIVGTGLRLSSEVDGDLLGLTVEQAQEKQKELERIWNNAKDDLEFEGDVKQADLQALVYRSMFESGDILVVRRRRLDPGNIVPTKVQLIEADRVSNPDSNMDTDILAGGVEVDGEGRTVAHHVSNRHPGDLHLAEITSWQRVPKYGRNGLTLSRLIFEKRRPGQRRGVPALAAVMEPLKQITRLTDYELMSSVVTAMFTIFVESENPATGQLPVAPVGEVAPTKAGDVFMPGGGAVIDLRPGEKVSTANPTRPNGAFDPFFRSLVQQIGMAIEIPYEVLMHLYQSSYSAARAATLDAFRFFMTRRQFLGDWFLGLVYEWVITDAVVSGLIDLPGFLTDDMSRKAWLNASWVGPGQNQINPKDDVGAAIMRIDAGLSTRKHESAGLLGLDWDRDIQPQREIEKERLESNGMPFAATATTSAPAGKEDDPEERERRNAEGDSPEQKREAVA